MCRHSFKVQRDEVMLQLRQPNDKKKIKRCYGNRDLIIVLYRIIVLYVRKCNNTDAYYSLTPPSEKRNVSLHNLHIICM